MKMNYRINFGQGQVHYPGDLAACKRYLSDHGDGYTYIQFRDMDTDEWFRYRIMTGRRLGQ